MSVQVARPAQNFSPIGTTRTLDYFWASTQAGDYNNAVGALSTRGNLLMGRQGSEPEGSAGVFFTDASGGTNTAGAQTRSNAKFPGKALAFKLAAKTIYRAPIGVPFLPVSSVYAGASSLCPEEFQVFRFRSLLAWDSVTAGTSGYEPWRAAVGLSLAAATSNLSGGGGLVGNAGLFLSYDSINGKYSLWAKKTPNSGSGSDGYNGGTNVGVTRVAWEAASAWGGDASAGLVDVEFRVYNATPLRDAYVELYVNGLLRYTATLGVATPLFDWPNNAAWLGGALVPTWYVDTPTLNYGGAGALHLVAVRCSLGPNVPGSY